MKQTINQVTKTVSEWCNNHLLISTFTTKNLRELNDIKYPLFMMRPSKLGFNNGSVKQSYAIVVADRLINDESNGIIVDSDMASIIEDFYIQFFDNDEDYNFIITDITDPTPIIDGKPNKISGWLFYITVEVGSTRNENAIPKTISYVNTATEEETPNYVPIETILKAAIEANEDSITGLAEEIAALNETIEGLSGGSSSETTVYKIETTKDGVMLNTNADVTLEHTDNTGIYVYTVNNAETIKYPMVSVIGDYYPLGLTYEGNVITVRTANGSWEGAHVLSFEILS